MCHRYAVCKNGGGPWVGLPVEWYLHWDLAFTAWLKWLWECDRFKPQQPVPISKRPQKLFAHIHHLIDRFCLDQAMKYGNHLFHASTNELCLLYKNAWWMCDTVQEELFTLRPLTATNCLGQAGLSIQLRANANCISSVTTSMLWSRGQIEVTLGQKGHEMMTGDATEICHSSLHLGGGAASWNVSTLLSKKKRCKNVDTHCCPNICEEWFGPVFH